MKSPSEDSVALVPVASGYFQSPELFARGRTVDTGLLAEALVFYDQVLIQVDNPHQFADLVSWLIQQGLTQSDLLRLIRRDAVKFYNYAFTTNPHIEPSNGFIYGLWNIQDQIMIKPNSFAERFLNFEGLRNSFNTLKQYERFCAAVDGKVIEVKADDLGSEGVINAWRDFLNPDRNALISRKLIGEMYGIHGRRRNAKVNVTVNAISSGKAFNDLLGRRLQYPHSILVRTPEEIGCGLHEVSWNFDLTSLRGLEGPRIIAGATLPLSAAAIANKYIWSAAKLNCDLYLPPSIDSIVGDKLYEADEVISKSQIKTQNIVRRLELKVAFPKLRDHVNRDELDFQHVLRFRKHSKKFRRFLSAEADINRDILVAYIEEATQSSGFTRIKRRVLPVLSAGAGLSATVGAAMGSTKAPIIGSITSFLLTIGSAIGVEWKPKVFGNWYSREIANLLKHDKKRKHS